MIPNFRKASCDTATRTAKLDALQQDFVNILDNGGVGRFASELGFQYKAASLFRETVIDGFSMTDPTPLFTERREGNMGDTYEFERLINTSRVVKYTPGSHPLSFTPRKGKYTISTAAYELPLQMDLMKVLTRQHTIAELSDMAAESIRRHYVNLTLTAIDSAVEGQNDINGRALKTAVGGADITQATLDAQLRRMGTYNNNMVIFGSKWALDPIFDFAADTDPARDELRARGVLGTYRGALIVAVEDDYDIYRTQWTEINAVNWEKLVWIAGDTPGAILLERDLSPLDYQELDPKRAMFTSSVRWDHGILVHSPWRYAVLETT